MKNTIFKYFLVCKGLSNYDVGGVAKGRRISADTGGSWFQNRRFFVKEKLRGLP